VAIGVKETQEIIRRAAVLSRSEPSVPVKLDPQQAGMATGPRNRKRSLLRQGSAPEYLRPSRQPEDEWQKLDDDIYKFLQLRKDQFGRLADPPSQQFIAEMEAQLKISNPGYDLGSYLGLVRLAADLDSTRHTFVTASERAVFHALGRRLTAGRKAGEYFDPAVVKRYLDLLDSNHPTTYRGLADLIRLVARASRLPLLGNLREAPTLCVTVLLQVVDNAARFNQNSRGQLEFQVGPMDVFLGARSVLCNRSVSHPTLAMIKELALDETGLYHDDLMEWLQSVGVFGSELTMLMPESLTEKGFALQGGSYSALELVTAAGLRLARSPETAERAMATLADAILHKVQQQDSHKDQQIQSILSHFNNLLKGERRSAARVTEDRQQARFDYMSAIQRAGQIARDIQTGQFKALVDPDAAKPARNKEPPRAQEAPERKPSPVARAEGARPLGPLGAPPAVPEPLPAAAVVARLTPEEYEGLLAEWDDLIGRLRKKLSAKSPVFKSLVSQLAKVRALDTCLAYGLTPGGGRCTGRLVKLIQHEETRLRLDLAPVEAETLEEAFSISYHGFLASLESLIAVLYEFPTGLQNLQFRLRDRKGLLIPGGMRAESVGDGRETTMATEGSEIDEPMLKLILGSILLAREANLALGASGAEEAVSAPFRSDGRLLFPAGADGASIGEANPFLAYCALLWVGKQTLGDAPVGDLETALMLMIRLTPEWRVSLLRKYRELAEEGKRDRSLPALGGLTLRPGWEKGFEKGFMAEVGALFAAEGSETHFDRRLLELLTGLQTDIDKAGDILEGDKLRLAREKLQGLLY
jgi:hypothetical protein